MKDLNTILLSQVLSGKTILMFSDLCNKYHEDSFKLYTSMWEESYSSMIKCSPYNLISEESDVE